MENKTFSIGFGALLPPIAKQLKAQGFKYNAEKAKFFELLRVCIINLKLGGINTASMHSKAKERLYNQIRKHVIQKNKLKVTDKTTTTTQPPTHA